MDIDMKMMAGQTTAQRPMSEIEKASEATSIAFFGSMTAELLAGQKAVFFRRGFEHAARGIDEFWGTATTPEEIFYDHGHDAFHKRAARSA